MENEMALQEEETLFVSLDNCWHALSRQMNENPTEETRRVMNLLARIIATVKSETRKRKDAAKKTDNAVSVEEWIAWFEEA